MASVILADDKKQEMGEKDERRSFNVKPIKTVGKTDGQTEKCGIHHQYSVCVCVFESVFSWQALHIASSLCGDCLSVRLFGADMKLSC